MNPNQQEEQPLMSEERRAFLRSIEDVITPERRELLAEIDRLRAENERLRKTTCTCERYWNGLLGEYRSLPDDSCPIHTPPEPTS